MRTSKTRFITYTALFLALLILFQSLSRPLGQYVTGSLVNLMLIVSVCVMGLWSGLTVAVVSPFLAFLLGIGPQFIQIIPLIALGNCVMILIYHFLLSRKKTPMRWAVAIPAGAALKCLTLYVSIVKLALPMLHLESKQAAALSAIFSLPQLATAAIGGVLAVLIVPLLLQSRNTID